jgi:3-methylcrotonyl-CoA carboxylase alpha subunit
MQVFGDQHGNVVHLFERDCSIQRRHQKVVEEAPAPHFPPETRQAMAEAAVAAARAIDYVGAGTMEFLLDQSGSFYFIEMNTRLQVEHPVTELITGFDLVEWQLRVAAGEKLPVRQDEITATGHAIEVRLYAEDPARNFLPQTGRLEHLRFPEASAHVRIDSGVEAGDTISVYYDPMIAKLVVWDRDRPAAVSRLRQALAATQVAGPTTNRAFLAEIAGHEAFLAGEVDTGFIDRHSAALLPAAGPLPDTALALAVVYQLEMRRRDAEKAARRSSDPWSPWNAVDGWRVNGSGEDKLYFTRGGERTEVAVQYSGTGYSARLPGGTAEIRATLDDAGDIQAEIQGRRLAATVLTDRGDLLVMAAGRVDRVTPYDPGAASATLDSSGGQLTAPMPGRIVRVLVSAGERVKRGTALIVLEAMKMEHTVTAPSDGVVERIGFVAGDLVQEGVELIGFRAGNG